MGPSLEFPHLSDVQAAKVTMNACTTSQTEEALLKIVNWARETHVMAQILQAVWEGKVQLGIDEQGKVTFAPTNEQEQAELRTAYAATEIAFPADGEK